MKNVSNLADEEEFQEKDKNKGIRPREQARGQITYIASAYGLSGWVQKMTIFAVFMLI
jgi:hypothetical protein